VGTEAAPSFDLLSTQLGKMDRVLRLQLAARPGAAIEGLADEAGGDGQVAAAGFSGAVRSRQDAIRALEAVAEFFRQHEPSSPVPMFCDRAKRLISLDFLEVLADIAPEAVAHARAAGGVKE
jgi:type VI secretion system protein ImpA